MVHGWKSAAGPGRIYVTHDQSEAMTMSNRVAVFKDGMIQHMYSPGALYEQLANAYVAQFIGENKTACWRIRSQCAATTTA